MRADLRGGVRRKFLVGVSYVRIDNAGLHISHDGDVAKLFAVDHVVICAGQESERSLYDELRALGVDAQLIGGADVAAELDAFAPSIKECASRSPFSRPLSARPTR